MTLLNDDRFPPRFVEASDRGDRVIRDLFRAAQSVSVTTDLDRRLIERRLREDHHEQTSVRIRRMQLVAVLTAVFGFGGVVGAAVYRQMRPAETPVQELPTAVELQAHVQRRHSSSKIATNVPLADLVDPPTMPAQRDRAANTSRHFGARTLKKAAVQVRETLSEQELLSQGLQYLRLKNDPGLALESLNVYDQRFASGALAPESKALRVEALVLLGRKQEAIAVLNDLLAQPLPGSESRRVFRAELNAAIGDYKAAVSDLNSVLTASAALDGSVLERALWARAVAHEYLGNVAAATMDLNDYLRRFPEGRFAALARKRQSR